MAIKSLFIEYYSYGVWKQGEIIAFLDKYETPSDYLNFKYRVSSKQVVDKPLTYKSVLIASLPNSKGTRIVYMPKLGDLKKWRIIKVVREKPVKKIIESWEMVAY